MPAAVRALPDVKAQLQKCDSPLLKKLEAAIDPLTDCADRIENTLVDDPPLTIREGGIIRNGLQRGGGPSAGHHGRRQRHHRRH